MNVPNESDGPDRRESAEPDSSQDSGVRYSPVVWLATGLGVGFVPIAPGTWGSAAAAVVFLLVAFGSGGRGICVWSTMAIVVAISSVACVALGAFTQTCYKRKDPSECTIDEWAGQALTYIFLPLGAGLGDWVVVAAVGFVAFRVFDIVKPPPARQLEKLPLGWGVLFDDLAAGVYANIASQLLLRLGYFGWLRLQLGWN